MAKKVYHYKDELNDDFAGTNIKTIVTPDDYLYVNNNFFFKLGAFVLYFIIAKPLTFLFNKIVYHQKTYNKKVLKRCKNKGYFIYANHTNMLNDAYLPQYLRWHKSYIVVGPDTTSIKGVRTIVKMLGCIPVPYTKNATDNYLKCIETRIKQKSTIVIYPEAHIWPYYTKIRPFGKASFRYPVDLNVPCYSLTNIYVKSKCFWRKKPVIRTYINGPFYPNPDLDRKDAIQDLRDKVYSSMLKEANKQKQVEYNEYICD